MEQPFISKVLCIIRNKNKILVHKVSGSLDNTQFYRPIGGTIEFAELSMDTLRREMKEELNSEIKNAKLITVLENIFDYKKENGEIIKVHEIDFVYELNLVRKELYEMDSIPIADRPESIALWVDVEKFKKGEMSLVPKTIIDKL